MNVITLRTLQRGTERRRGAGVRRRLVSGALTGASLIVGLAVLGGGVAMRLTEVHLSPVLSGSMLPTAGPGDLAITVPVPITTLRVGDVIVLTPPDESQPVMHRIVTLEHTATDQIQVRTRGDANRIDDPWQAVLVGPTGYRLVAVIPLLGRLVAYRGGLLIAAGLVLGASLLLEMRPRKERRRGSELEPRAHP